MISRSLLMVLAAATVLNTRTVPTSASERPNVILIFTDDQGSIDLNCYGAQDLITPHLDRLAHEGTRFTQFYVGAPVCSPSRAALLTGRYPQRAGVPGNMPSQPGQDGMPSEQVTIAEMMKQAGYITGHVGKWHLGYTPNTMPNGQGFDYSFGHMGGCIDNYSHFFYWVPPNRHDLWRDGREVWYDGQFFGDLMVEECKRFIDQNRQRPFFLYWAINMPHYPLQGTSKWREKYTHLASPRRMYAEFVSTMDEMVGNVLGHLDDRGLREQTLIIYLSDHGHSVENRTFSGGGNSGPYRGHKFTLWEGGIRIPCIVSWPGHIPQAAVRDQVAISIDWLPTIAHYCDVALPESSIDGLSIARVIESQDATSPHEILHWETSGGKHWAVREGDWKLVHNGPATEYHGQSLPAAEDFLSQLSADVTETKNLAPAHPDRVARLKSLHEAWSATLTAGTQQESGEKPSADDSPLSRELGDGYSLLGTIQPRHAREIQSSNWSVGAETMDRDFTVYAHWKKYLGPLGAKKARLQSGWAKTEKVRGRYDWNWLDEIILDMVAQGVEPWLCLCYGNPAYPDGGGTGLGGGQKNAFEEGSRWRSCFYHPLIDPFESIAKRTIGANRPRTIANGGSLQPPGATIP